MTEFISRYLMNSSREFIYIITRHILLGATEGSFLRNFEEKRKQLIVSVGKILRCDSIIK